jgi:tripartite-type tricarboxylate transporter receptor subunit TctC
MILSKKRILFRLVAFAAAVVLSGFHPNAAPAQDIPAGKPIHLIVGFAPGGATDIVARVLATRLSESLGQQVIVEDRSGGGGTIATDQVG